MTKKKSGLDLLITNFVGENVTIYLMDKVKNISETSKGIEETTAPIMIGGYVIDMDDVWVYLGDNQQSINTAIQKRRIAFMEVKQEKDEYEDVLDKIPTPDKSRMN